MKINRLDHIGINVVDLDAVKEFFLDLGLELSGEWEAEGAWLDRIVGLKDAKTACVALRTPDSKVWIELVKYITPLDEAGVQPSYSNTLGIRHLTFEVEDLEGMVAKLKQKGMEPFSEIQPYENVYKLVYVRGPEGIILELAERILE